MLKCRCLLFSSMRLWQKTIVMMFGGLFLVLGSMNQPAIPHVFAQSGEAQMTRCLSDWNSVHNNPTSREQFERDMFCEAQVAHFILPDQYVQCALTEYDRILAANPGELSAANRVEIKRFCSPNMRSPATAPSTAGSTTNNSTTTTSSRDNGQLRSLVFTKDPNSVFIGTFTGPTTANLRGAYADPLLMISDRQTAFQVLVRFFLGFIGIVCLLFLVFNGFRYTMSRGEEAQMTQAKKGIMYAIIGLVIVLAAYTIVATVLNFGAQPTPNVGVGVGLSF